jgi:hypothetical protein
MAVMLLKLISQNEVGVDREIPEDPGLYQGTTSVVPQCIPNGLGFTAPAHHFLMGNPSNKHST